MTTKPSPLAPLPLCVALALFVMPSQGAAEELSGVASVLDGDTLEIHGKRVRLHGIDAPESSQTCTRDNGKAWRCGQQAALALQKKIGKATVRCRGDTTDAYQRLIGVCRANGVDLNGWLVENGWAIAYREYSTDYVVQEGAAKNARRNIWSGVFEEPSKYRKKAKTRERQERRAGCDIKGNISRDGKRVYHLPGSEWYDKTRINTRNGERWFCSEQEAKAAGFVAPRPPPKRGADNARSTPPRTRRASCPGSLPVRDASAAPGGVACRSFSYS